MESVCLNNGIRMPVLGFGLFDLADYDNAVTVTIQAIQNGYRHLDTATRYQNEKAVGEGIRSSGVPRNEIFLTTKVWNDMQRSGNVRRSLEESLTAFGTDYVDLFLIHWPVPDYYLNTWKEMEVLYQEGLARAIGVCNCRDEELDEIAKISAIVPAVNQIEIQPYFQQKPMIASCARRNIQVESWGTLTSGKSNLFQDPVLNDIGSRYGKTAAQVVIRWGYQRGVVPLVKSGNPIRQKQNLDIFDFSLDKNDMDRISSLDAGLRLGRDPKDSDF